MADDGLSATLGALADASERARSIDAEIRALALRAAAEGANYGEIGRALGITRQGARKRFPRLLDAQRPATTSVVGPESEDGGRRPADRTGGPPQPMSATTTMVVVAESAVGGEDPPGGPTAEPDHPPATPTETPPPADMTTEVVTPVEPAVAGRPDRPRSATARPVTSRPRGADQPRVRPRGPMSAMDKAVAAGAAMTDDAVATMERTETGYRVLVDGVECGTLRPDYTGTVTKRPRWLPMAPGPVSVFPPGRSYRTRDEAVTHLLADLRHRAAEHRRGRRGEVSR